MKKAAIALAALFMDHMGYTGMGRLPPGTRYVCQQGFNGKRRLWLRIKPSSGYAAQTAGTPGGFCFSKITLHALSCPA